MMGENWDLYIYKTEWWERKEVAQEKERKNTQSSYLKYIQLTKCHRELRSSFSASFSLAKLDTLSTHDDILYNNMIWSEIIASIFYNSSIK